MYQRIWKIEYSEKEIRKMKLEKEIGKMKFGKDNSGAQVFRIKQINTF